MRSIFELLVPKSIKTAVRRISLCFISRNKLIFVSFPDKSVKEFSFPQGTVSDADVLNKEEYRSAVFEWVHNSVLKISEIIFVVSENLIFSKEFEADKIGKSIFQQETSSFIEVVPFQRVYLAKTSNSRGKSTIMITNRDVVHVIVRAFESVGFTNIGIYPELSLVSASASGIDSENVVDRARKHIDLYTLKAYSQNSFQASLSSISRSASQMTVSEAVQQPISPAIATIVVVIVVGASLLLTYWNFEQTRQKDMLAIKKRIELLSTKTATSNSNLESKDKPETVSAKGESPTVTPTPVKETKRVYKIQVLYTEDSLKLYEMLRASITTTYGYEVSGEVTSNVSTESRILMDQRTPKSVLDEVKKVMDALKIVYSSSIDSKSEDFNIVILLSPPKPIAPNIETNN